MIERSKKKDWKQKGFFFLCILVLHSFLLFVHLENKNQLSPALKKQKISVRKVEIPPPPPPPKPVKPKKVHKKKPKKKKKVVPKKRKEAPPKKIVKKVVVPRVVPKQEKPKDFVEHFDTLTGVSDAPIPKQEVNLFYMNQVDEYGNVMAAYPQVARWKDCQGSVEVDMLVGPKGTVINRKNWKFKGDGLAFQYEIFNLFKYLKYPIKKNKEEKPVAYWLHKKWDFHLKKESEKGWWEKKFPKHCKDYSTTFETSKTIVNPDKQNGTKKIVHEMQD